MTRPWRMMTRYWATVDLRGRRRLSRRPERRGRRGREFQERGAKGTCDGYCTAWLSGDARSRRVKAGGEGGYFGLVCSARIKMEAF